MRGTYATLAAALLALTVASAGAAHALNPQPEPPGKARAKAIKKPDPGYPLIKNSRVKSSKARKAAPGLMRQ
jgi:hypothetical protein